MMEKTSMEEMYARLGCSGEDEFKSMCQGAEKAMNALRPFSLEEKASWNNEILHVKQGQQYSRQADTIVDKIGRVWLRMMYNDYPYSSMYERRYRYTVLLALHLRAPTPRMEYVFDVKFQRPTPEDAKHPVTGVDLAPDEIEEGAQHLNDLVQDDDALIAEIERWLEDTDGISDNAVKRVEQRLERLTQKHRIAFYAFLAAVTCSVVAKSPENVRNRWENSAAKDFGTFYSVDVSNIHLPPPSFKTLELFQSIIRPGAYLTIALYKAFLMAKEDPSATRLGNIKDVLDYTLLSPTALNGLKLISLCYEAARRENSTNIEEFFDKVNWKGSSKSISAVREFIKQYNSSVDNFQEKNWFYWARIIDPSYFLSLRIKDHTFLAAICAYFIEGGPTGPTWNAAGLKNLDSETKTGLWDGLKCHITKRGGVKKPTAHYDDLFTL